MNHWGQLGRKSGDEDKFNRINLPKAFQVNAGEFSSFVLMDYGTFYSWGRDQHGQLGLGPELSISQHEPVHNDYIDDVIKLSGTRNSVFALTSNGDVYSWGHNFEGCLGHEENVNRPQLIKGVPPVKFVASGLSSYLIFKNGSTAICGRLWGSDNSSTTPQLFDLDIRFTFIHTTSTSAVGIDEDQKLWSWGENSEGSLGDGTRIDSPIPIPVKVDGQILSAVAAYDHSVAVDVEGTVLTWGRGDAGRIARTGPIIERQTPGAIPDFENNPHFLLNCNRDSTVVYERMSPGVSPGFKGNGTLSLDNATLQLSSMTAILSQISLSSSIVTTVNVSIDTLINFKLFSSTVIMSQFTTVSSNNFVLELESSELYLEDEVVITSSSITLFALNSDIYYWTQFFTVSIINLNYSSIFSNLNNEVTFSSFDCFHCQLLTNQKINITKHLEINSANLSANIELQQSASDVILSGNIRILNDLQLFSPTKLVNLQLSTLQSELPIKPYLHCFSNVLIQNLVSILNVDVDFKHNVLLLNASLQLDQDLVIKHKLSGSGLIESNVLNYGSVVPDKSLEFSKKLSLFTSSTLKYLLSSSLDHQISIVDDVYLLEYY
ncbi:hypothetical protein GEMRC1_008651 [Eukaryota sp. GEM-RC1]